jgi:hypothetical protein
MQYMLQKRRSVMRYVYLVAVVLVALVTGCSQNMSGQVELRKTAEQFVPSDADERIVAPDLPWLQISFNVRVPWLQFAFDENRIKDAQRSGWRLCQPTTSEWESYEDRSVTPPSYRRQRTYILYKDGSSIQFFGMYNTPVNESGPGNSNEKPVQQGILIAKKETLSEALQMAASFHLSCDAPTVSH